MSAPVVGFAGLSHLGVVSSVAAAAHGFEVIAWDGDPGTVERLGAGVPPVREPGLDDLLGRHAERLTFTADIDRLAAADVVYLATDVPTDDHGNSDVGPIADLARAVIGVLGPSALLVVLSQVAPGFTRSLPLDPARRFYQVETLVFGQAVERALSPERITVGCEDPHRALPASLAAFLAAFSCPVIPMTYESAELSKIAINVCLVATLTAANTLAELCERIGADWSEIVPALQLDRRIGPHAYLRPGLGLAGGNLERDLATVVRLAAEVGSDAGAVRAAIANSGHRRDWVLRQVHERVLPAHPDPQLGVLGLAYKENTHSTKNSAAIALIAALRPYRIVAHDPAVSADEGLHPRLRQVRSSIDVCDGATALVVMTPWPEYRGIDPAEISARMVGRTVIDPYGVLDAAACRAAGLDHVSLGVRPH